MYFPYLRGKQFELIALREYLVNNFSNNKIYLIFGNDETIENIKVLSDAKE